MENRRIGSLTVSVVGIGCNNFGARLDQAETTRVVHAALDNGVTFFDNADIYGWKDDVGQSSESLLGVALGARRHEAVIATKFGMGTAGNGTEFSARPEYIRRALDASLRRLQVDTIDLYQLHFPDATTPLEDTLATLSDLRDEGKIREIGCSNFDGAALRSAAVTAGSGMTFRSVQNQFSLLHRTPERDDTLSACADLGVGFLPYYPLANGWLTGKFDPDEALVEGTRLANMAADRQGTWWSAEMKTRVRALREVSRNTGIPLLTLAFSWLASFPVVSSVIAGASSPEQVLANAHAVIELPSDIVEQLERASA
jgi:aryl-alcohol dehydrogenase-like predicted oxidoreductase